MLMPPCGPEDKPWILPGYRPGTDSGTEPPGGGSSRCDQGQLTCQGCRCQGFAPPPPIGRKDNHAAGGHLSGTGCRVAKSPSFSAPGQRALLRMPAQEDGLRGLTRLLATSPPHPPCGLTQQEASSPSQKAAVWPSVGGRSGVDESSAEKHEIHLCFFELGHSRCLRRQRVNYRDFQVEASFAEGKWGYTCSR